MVNIIKININVNKQQFADIQELLAKHKDTLRVIMEPKCKPSTIEFILLLIEKAKGQWVSSSTITRKTQGLTVEARKSMLDALIKQRSIERQSIQKSKGRPEILYRVPLEFVNEK